VNNPHEQVADMLRSSAHRLLEAVVKGNDDKAVEVLMEERERIGKACDLLDAQALMPAIWAHLVVGCLHSGYDRYNSLMADAAERSDELLDSGMHPDEVRKAMRKHSERLEEHMRQMDRLFSLLGSDGAAACAAMGIMLGMRSGKQVGATKEALN
jgi:hypothetical protein